MQGIIDIKGKPYTLISERVRLAHETRESFEMVSSGPLQVGPLTVWQVVILVNGKRYIGTSEIKFDASPKTADGTNPVACAETSATGRALGMAGLGSVESIASAEEVVRAIAEQDSDKPATSQQLSSIKNLEKLLDQEPISYDGLGYDDCAALLKELSARLSEQRKSKAS